MISVIETQVQFEKFAETLQKCSRFAFYSTAASSSNKSPLSLIAIDTEGHGMFLFDAQVFGIDPIRPLLENPEKIKIMFDCRRDSDSLYYVYDTILSGILDLQVMDYIIKHSEKSGYKVSSILSIVEEQFGCFAAKKLKQIKKKVAKSQTLNYDWLEGPSRDEIIQYMTEELRWFFPIFYESIAKYKKDCPMLTAEKISEIIFYSNMYSASASSSKCNGYDPTVEGPTDSYRNHNFMPWGIFKPRPIGDILCAGCRLSFPSAELETVDSGSSDQMCRICREVKLSLAEEEQNVYSPNLEHFRDASIPEISKLSLTQESETETDDSGISLPENLVKYRCQKHISIPGDTLRKPLSNSCFDLRDST